MIAILPLLLQVAPPLPTPPADLAALPPIALVRPWPQSPRLSDFVHDEVVAGRCKAATQGATGWVLNVDMAVMIDAGGQVRRILPRAIDCPTVEQYASGLASRMVRHNVFPPGTDAWFRMTISFAWGP